MELAAFVLPDDLPKHLAVEVDLVSVDAVPNAEGRIDGAAFLVGASGYAAICLSWSSIASGRERGFGRLCPPAVPLDRPGEHRALAVAAPVFLALFDCHAPPPDRVHATAALDKGGVLWVLDADRFPIQRDHYAGVFLGCAVHARGDRRTDLLRMATAIADPRSAAWREAWVRRIADAGGVMPIDRREQMRLGIDADEADFFCREAMARVGDVMATVE